MRRKIFAAVLCCALLLTAFTGCNSADYKAALALADQEKYTEAEKAFKTLGTYKDAAAQAQRCAFLNAADLEASGRYAEAQAAFAALEDYADAAVQARICGYLNAQKLESEELFSEAQAAFASLGDYEDAAERAENCRKEGKYRQAAEQLKDRPDPGDYSEAVTLLKEIGEYKDSSALLQEASLLTAEYLHPALTEETYAGTVTDTARAEALLSLYENAAGCSDAVPEKLSEARVLLLAAYIRQNGERTENGYALTVKEEDTHTDLSVSTEEVKEKYSVLLRDDGTFGLCFYRDESAFFAETSGTLTLQTVYDYDILHDPLSGRSGVRASISTPGVISTVYEANLDIATAFSPADFRDSKYESTVVRTGKTESDGRTLNAFPYGETVRAFEAYLGELPFEISLADVGFGEAVLSGVKPEPVPQPEEAAEENGTNAAEAQEAGTAYMQETPEAKYTEPMPTTADMLNGRQRCFAVTDTVLRKAPSEESEEILTVTYGTQVSATAVREGWAFVKTGKGEEGWTPIAYLFGKWMFGSGLNAALRDVERTSDCRVVPKMLRTVTAANVRFGPSGNKEQIARYEAGTECVWVASSGAWRLVWHEGKYGWIHSSNF